jgi:hypothetical protein
MSERVEYSNFFLQIILKTHSHPLSNNIKVNRNTLFPFLYGYFREKKIFKCHQKALIFLKIEREE